MTTYTYHGHKVELTGRWNEYAPNPLVEVESVEPVFIITGSKPPYRRGAIARIFVSPLKLVEVGEDDGTIWSGNAPDDCTCVIDEGDSPDCPTHSDPEPKHYNPNDAPRHLKTNGVY